MMAHIRPSLPGSGCSVPLNVLRRFQRMPTTLNARADPPPVEMEGLRKVYGDVVAVDNISCTLARGSVTALLGGNGAGKTTTVAMLMGLVVPTSGSARVFGADMARHRHLVLHRMNFESPYADIPLRLKVRQNFEIFGRLYGVRDLEKRIREVAAEQRVLDLLERPYG